MFQKACRRFTGASSAGGVRTKAVCRFRKHWASAAEVAREHGVFRTASGVRQAEAHDEAGCACQAQDRIAGRVLGVGRAPSGALWVRADGVCHRVGRAARQDARPVERRGGARPGRIEPRPVGAGVIQITPQMRILVAIEPVDGRKGIDSLARLCQDKLQADPFSGCLFVFRSRRGTSIRILVYDLC
jgi:hypothetical protein